jgi:Uma2 family endonuclease
MEAVLEQLLQSPKLQIYFEQLREAIKAENRRKDDFVDGLSPEVKGEFVNGQAIYHSPARLGHVVVRDRLSMLMGAYVNMHGLGLVGGEKLLVALTRNAYEPDICFFKRERAERFFADQVKFPAPDLVVEVLSPGTEANDRGVKFEDYAAHGVGEYWIVDPELEVVEQYVLAKDSFEAREKRSEGVIHSPTIGGFAIEVRALFDTSANAAELRRILTSAQA